jgi:hypothetical protein
MHRAQVEAAIRIDDPPGGKKMKFTKPRSNESFTISAVPEWPSIPFETDAKGTHTWQWSISWGTYKKSGRETTPGNTWNAQSVVTDFGGTLTVRAEAQKAAATISVKIKGTNPPASLVTQYLAKKSNADGFDKIIAHESKFVHFTPSTNEPVKSFDNGYGMCQLTTPAPNFEQVWNWQSNVDAGLKLFEQKRTAAMTYLSQSNRSYTTDQLKYEAVCRWNGGSYHEWDATSGWIRKANILCDTQTGNIGWDMNDAQNKGKTEAELRKRDSGAYSKPPAAGAHWMYSGVCYADRILD